MRRWGIETALARVAQAALFPSPLLMFWFRNRRETQACLRRLVRKSEFAFLCVVYVVKFEVHVHSI
jgi:hypothetical protein